LPHTITLPTEVTVLDIGTGTGIMLRELVAPDRYCLGVDLAMSMLRVGQSLRRVQGWPRCALLQADANTLGMLSANSCDAVVASFGLSECDPDRALHACARVLRPGGQLHLQEWGPYDGELDPRFIDG
jgi:ubiquinone/menaquinone biosynthesis C-methylase UbiE